MRIVGSREAAARGAGAPAAPAPEWRPSLFTARQRRLRSAVLAWLAQEGPLATTHVLQRARGLSGQYATEDVEHTLASLRVDGLLDAERRTEPRRHGGREMREYTYWRLAAAPAGDGR